jgi:hypothetical protein
MTKYQVEIVLEIVKQVEVEANSKAMAESKAIDKFRTENKEFDRQVTKYLGQSFEENIYPGSVRVIKEVKE